jgi:HlyD family secretion protein
MFKKLAQILLFALFAVALLSGGYVLAAGSPQAALDRLLAGVPQPQGAVEDLSAAAPVTAASITAATGATAGDSSVTLQTTAVRAAESLDTVSAAGNISLVEEHYVVMEVNGVVQNVSVRVGDAVAVGDPLLSLDTRPLEQAVKQAQLNLSSAQIELDKLLAEADADDIAAAQADLDSAQAALDDLLSPPGDRELAAAQSKAASAWSKYRELQAGPSEARLTQRSSELRKTEIALQEARRAYEAIAWRNDKGMTAEAAAYEKATVDYETALAAYEETNAPADASELQSALSAAQSAQQQLEDLQDGASEANIAAAKAKVVSAQTRLAQLLAGAGANDIAAAQIKIDQAQLNLEDAIDQLANAQVVAPIAGTVLSVSVEKGQRVGTGNTAVVLADTSWLELVVNVAEVDVRKVLSDQPAAVTLDAFPGRVLAGAVTTVAPSSASEGGVVNYAVTIRLTDADLSGIRAGMTAVATLQSEVQANRWLVPTVAIQETGSGEQVTVIRNGQPVLLTVTAGETQGEWTIVTATALQAGDQVVGSTASFLGNGLPEEFSGPGRAPGPFGRGD